MRSPDEAAIFVDKISVAFRSYSGRPTTLKESVLKFLATGKVLSYPTFDALENLSFSVNRGEVLAVIGSNGSGKSTLLRVLAGVLAPTAGSATIRGKVSSLIDLGAGFDPELTAIENIYLNGSIHRRSRREMRRRVEPILEFAELAEFAHTPLKYFSSGMAARLGFSSALDLDPDILIVDEVLAVGDERFQARCLDAFRQFIARGKTIVLVTHSMELVQELAGRALVLAKGSLVFDGSPADAVRSYRDPSYAARLGDPREDSESPSQAARTTAGAQRSKQISREYPEHWRPYLSDWWQRTYLDRIIKYEGKYWFVKFAPERPKTASRERLAYLLGRNWLNIAEVRLLSEQELAALRECGLEFSSAATVENTYLVRFALDHSPFCLSVREFDYANIAEIVFSLWIRRRDAHSFNRVYVRGLPVFFDHLSGLMGEPGLIDLERFFFSGPDAGHAGWWRFEERGKNGRLDSLIHRQREKQAFEEESPARQVTHYVCRRDSVPALISKAARQIEEISAIQIHRLAIECGFDRADALLLTDFLVQTKTELNSGIKQLLRLNS